MKIKAWKQETILFWCGLCIISYYLVHIEDRNHNLKSLNECIVYDDLLNQTAVRLRNNLDMLSI
jgi:hypothetical protein